MRRPFFRLGASAALAAAVLGWTLLCASCNGDPPSTSIVIPDASAEGGAVGDEDEDRDGLCDATEEELGSSSQSADSDGDGLPDFVELIYGFVATDPSTPDSDQLGYMVARAGAETGFDIRLSGEGQGSDLTGFFQDLASPYEDGITAGSYFVTSEALAAVPPEAVRAIEAGQQRFVSVLGPVRLELFALFRADDLIDEEGCARAYPFRYRLKDDRGALVDDRLYLLIVAAEGADTPDDFCVPMPCI